MSEPAIGGPKGAGRKGFLLLSVLVGMLAGVGIFTLLYAEGLSYLSNDPAACANCHIMWPQYEGWQKASHHTVATCVDCHLPKDFIGKYTAKAVNGYHHSSGFTFQNFHEPIHIKGNNARILQANCLRCHEDFVHEMLAAVPQPGDVSCVHCHATVGHGDQVGLGGPERRDELRERASL